MESYLRAFQQGLKMDPEETRTIVAEVRGNLEDLAAHLRAEGYGPEEAEREAVRRLDEARGLARAVRRARRRAPLPLQSLALLLGAVGLAALGIAVVILQTLVGRAILGTQRGPITPDFGIEILTGLTILVSAVMSLFAAASLFFGWRAHPRRIGAVLAGVVFYDIVLAVPLLGLGPQPPLPPVAVPGAARFAAYGLVGRPAPGQENSPVVVDRVYTDRTVTYVQYHIPNAARDSELFPALTDDQGRLYPFNFIDCDPCNGSQSTRHIGGMRQIMPWRTTEQGLARFTELHSDSRVAVLHFGVGKDDAPIETVRVPLDLRGWRRATGGMHPFIVVQRHGVRVNLTRVVRGVTTSAIDYTIDANKATAPPGSAMYGVQADLSDARGHIIEQIPWSIGGDAFGDSCISPSTGGAHCGPAWLLPYIARGTHLVLTVHTVAIYPRTYGVAPIKHTINGPWRIHFVMP